MKKIIFLGKSQCGKSTLTQRLNKTNTCLKTQNIQNHNSIIDTPGEYMENRLMASALRLHTYEADVVGLMIDAGDSYSIFPPNITTSFGRESIGIVSQIDKESANPTQAENWLRLAGCQKIFHISSITGQGIDHIVDYLNK